MKKIALLDLAENMHPQLLCWINPDDESAEPFELHILNPEYGKAFYQLDLVAADYLLMTPGTEECTGEGFYRQLQYLSPVPDLIILREEEPEGLSRRQTGEVLLSHGSQKWALVDESADVRTQEELAPELNEQTLGKVSVEAEPALRSFEELEKRAGENPRAEASRVSSSGKGKVSAAKDGRPEASSKGKDAYETLLDRNYVNYIELSAPSCYGKKFRECLNLLPRRGAFSRYALASEIFLQLQHACPYGVNLFERSLLRHALYYIYRHFHTDMNLERAANAIGTKGNYLSCLFRRAFGVNYVSYVNRLRVSRAALYLTESEISVQKAARLVGYGNDAYFARVFMRVTGVSPRQFCLRERNRIKTRRLRFGYGLYLLSLVRLSPGERARHLKRGLDRSDGRFRYFHPFDDLGQVGLRGMELFMMQGQTLRRTEIESFISFLAAQQAKRDSGASGKRKVPGEMRTKESLLSDGRVGLEGKQIPRAHRGAPDGGIVAASSAVSGGRSPSVLRSEWERNGGYASPLAAVARWGRERRGGLENRGPSLTQEYFDYFLKSPYDASFCAELLRGLYLYLHKLTFFTDVREFRSDSSFLEDKQCRLRLELMILALGYKIDRELARDRKKQIGGGRNNTISEVQLARFIRDLAEMKSEAFADADISKREEKTDDPFFAEAGVSEHAAAFPGEEAGAVLFRDHELRNELSDVVRRFGYFRAAEEYLRKPNDMLLPEADGTQEPVSKERSVPEVSPDFEDPKHRVRLQWERNLEVEAAFLNTDLSGDYMSLAEISGSYLLSRLPDEKISYYDQLILMELAVNSKVERGELRRRYRSNARYWVEEEPRVSGRAEDYLATYYQERALMRDGEGGFSRAERERMILNLRLLLAMAGIYEDDEKTLERLLFSL